MPSRNVTGFSLKSDAPWNVAGAKSDHGTHVAGTILAIGSNHKGVVGVLPRQQFALHHVRAFDSNGGFMYASGVADAVKQCDEAGAKVVNMSLGGPQATQTERDQTDALAKKGILLLAAAGNDGKEIESYPADFEGIMFVAATYSDKDWADFSTFNQFVEISALGQATLPTLPRGTGRMVSLTVDGTAIETAIPQQRLLQVRNSQQGYKVNTQLNSGSFDGPGIANDERNSVLRLFSRLDDSRSKTSGGFGLGLAIVSASVKRMGGAIVLGESKMGGLKVSINLPLHSTANLKIS